jgi:hypothetical protein
LTALDRKATRICQAQFAADITLTHLSGGRHFRADLLRPAIAVITTIVEYNGTSRRSDFIQQYAYFTLTIKPVLL